MLAFAVDILNALEKVSWAPLAFKSEYLERHGYENGICGIGDHRCKELAPHHATQVHGTKIIEATDSTSYRSLERIEADGIFTSSNIPIAVKTADCLPLLIGSSATNFAMVVHAGWRGLTSGILLKALQTADTYAPRNSLVVCVGPAISQTAFEVGREVVDKLIGSSALLNEDSWTIAVAKGMHDKWHIDLQVAAAIQLYLAGLNSSNIEIIRSCTRDSVVKDDESAVQNKFYRWHSYRRDGRGCGSNWSWIRRI